MPIFAAFIGSLFGGLIEGLGQYLAKKAAVTVATIAVLAGAWLAMFAGIKASIAAVSVALPTQFSVVLSLVKPTGFEATMSLLLGGLLAIYSYKSFKDKTLATSG